MKLKIDGKLIEPCEPDATEPTYPEIDLSPAIACRDMDQLRPDFRLKVELVLSDLNALGIADYRVIETYRTQERQEYLYHVKKTTKTLHSKHTRRIAADICPFLGALPAWDRKDLFDEIGEAAKAHGLCWGGNFRMFYDGPHVEAIE